VVRITRFNHIVPEEVQAAANEVMAGTRWLYPALVGPMKDLKGEAKVAADESFDDHAQLTTGRPGPPALSPAPNLRKEYR